MQLISYFIIRGFLFFLSFISLKNIQRLASFFSPVCYRLIPKYRKRALSNLALAKELNLSNPQIVDLAKKSLFHLLVTALEYGKLSRTNSIKSFCSCVNPEETNKLLDDKKGVIFFCGHQSNWELLFLDATSRHFGVCIGKPIKNVRLYQFILKIREKFLGTVIVPKEAYKGCMKALKKGELVGVVGDQGMPESSFTYNCLGRNAYMTTLPALLSVRSGAPVYVATIKRLQDRYEITYSGPCVSSPDSPDPISEITFNSLQILDQKIKENPEQWMWQHNRWKIPYKPYIPRKYKHDAICVMLSDKNTDIDEDLQILKEAYKGAYLIIFKPDSMIISQNVDEIITYHDFKDCFVVHYGPKLIIDLVGIPGIESFYKKLSLFQYIKCTRIKQLVDEWKNNYAY